MRKTSKERRSDEKKEVNTLKCSIREEISFFCIFLCIEKKENERRKQRKEKKKKRKRKKEKPETRTESRESLEKIKKKAGEKNWRSISQHLTTFNNKYTSISIKRTFNFYLFCILKRKKMRKNKERRKEERNLRERKQRRK